MVSFNLSLSKFEGPPTSDVLLKYDLMYAPLSEIQSALQASLDSGSVAIHEFRIPPKALIGLHSYCPVHVDVFYAVLDNSLQRTGSGVAIAAGYGVIYNGEDRDDENLGGLAKEGRLSFLYNPTVYSFVFIHSRQVYNPTVCLMATLIPTSFQLGDRQRPQISIPSVTKHNVNHPHHLKISCPRSIRVELLPWGQSGACDPLWSDGRMIRGYVEDGLYRDALKMFVEMLERGPPLAEFGSFPSLLKAVGELGDIREAKKIHGLVLKVGAVNDVSVANSALGMYWKCGAADRALCMFKGMVERDSVSFNTMVSGACGCGDFLGSLLMFKRMVGEFGVFPNRVACLSAISACGSIPSWIHGREIHTYAIKSDLVCHQYLVSGLVDMYMKCGDVTNAENVFSSVFADEGMLENPVIWNTMIFGYVENGCLAEAAELLNKMLDLGIRIDGSTLVAALCLASHAEQLHGQACKLGLHEEVRVVGALVDAYFKSGNVEAAERLFGEVKNRSLVLWGTMVSNYVQDGSPIKSLELCHRFMNEYGRPDPVILLGVLRACSALTLRSKGMEFHAMAVKQGVQCDAYVGGAIVDLYAKCGDVESAEAAFNNLRMRDVVSWNALISAYSQNDLVEESLKALHGMQLENIIPNSVTVAAAVSVSAQLSAMYSVKEVHGYILRNGYESNLLVSNSLVSAYAKCGDIDAPLVIFDRIRGKDVISWNSIILGLGMHSMLDEMLLLFERMTSSEVRPDHATFSALLSACSHTGRVNLGLEYFKRMLQEYDLEPRLEQYTCMVDLLGRAGQLNQAYQLITKMPFSPDKKIWGSLLASCKTHGDERLAETVARQVFDLDPDNVGYRVILSNLYESEGRWDDVEAIRSDIRDKGLKKDPGCSWIVVDKATHSFTAGDCSHFQFQEIYVTLVALTAEILHSEQLNEDPEVAMNIIEEPGIICTG